MVDADHAFTTTVLSGIQNTGEVFGPVAVDHVKKEFVQAIRSINGHVSSATITDNGTLGLGEPLLAERQGATVGEKAKESYFQNQEKNAYLDHLVKAIDAATC